MDAPNERRPSLEKLRGLKPRLCEQILGQDDALSGLAEALLAGELGHTRAGRPRSLILALGPTGTGKTRAVTAASEHLFGTAAVARVNGAEFSSEERVPLLLGLPGGGRGLLGLELGRMRAAGGRILLLDEIEKAHPRVSDLLLGIEEAAVTLADGETLDLSGVHVIATSNVGSSAVVDMQGVARASLRRFVEQEAGDHFRPEVLARFTAILVFGHLSREVQVRICKRMLDDETSFQSSVLEAAFGHAHRVRARADVGPRLVSEGWHRRLGARPMRNVVERRVRTALVEARLRGALVEGVRETVLFPDGHAGLRAGLARAPFVL